MTLTSHDKHCQTASEHVVAVVDPMLSGTAYLDALRKRGIRFYVVDTGVTEGRRDWDGCEDILVYRGEQEAVAWLKEKGTTIILAGCEQSVSVAERLQCLVRTPGNGAERIAGRRDKRVMHAVADKAGIRVPRQAIVSSVVEARAAAVDLPLVVKPPMAMATNDVFLCHSSEEVEESVALIVSKSYGPFTTGGTALIQEYIEGREFMINTVSFEGQHLCTDIWESVKFGSESTFLYREVWLMERRGPLQSRIVEFTTKILNALEFVVGPGHTEVKMRPDGELVFLEVAARIPGPELHVETAKCRYDGKNQVEIALDSYLRQKLPEDDYVLSRHGLIHFILQDVDGPFRAVDEAKIRELPSFNRLRLRYAPGEPAVKTVDLITSAGDVRLHHSDMDVLKQDNERLGRILANSG